MVFSYAFYRIELSSTTKKLLACNFRTNIKTNLLYQPSTIPFEFRKHYELIITKLVENNLSLKISVEMSNVTQYEFPNNKIFNILQLTKFQKIPFF